MNNQLTLTAEFERQKNLKALGLTALVAGLILLMIFFIRWSIPPKVDPPAEDFVEFTTPNIGSSDLGSGTDQPLRPGDPAPAEQTSYTPPQPTAAHEEAVKDVTNDNETEKEAPPVVKPAVTHREATKVEPSKTVKVSNPTPAPVVVQAPPRPKAVLGRTTGGTGNGGNGADTYKPGTGEGVAGGTGDQGRPGGSPNGRDYTGTPKSFGVKILNIPNQTFEDDFNRNATVYMDIVVDPNGKVTSASFHPKGSTTSEQKYIDIARRTAFQLKTFGASEAGQKGTVGFTFKVRG